MINDFNVPLKSGTISQNETWNSDLYITGNITVPSGITLNINCDVYFAKCDTINILGTVNLQDGAILNINHCSNILIDDSNIPNTDPGLFFLDWGSTITGSNSGWYEQVPPGHNPGKEKKVPGDRIIAQNGGVITTSDDTQNIGNPITIASNSGDLWSGISIINPNNNDDYWFVNCDISGIVELSISGLTRVPSYLKLYKSNFHDNALLMVRDGHRLHIEGDSAGQCYVQDNSFGVQAYNSPIFVDYANFTGNGTGLNLNYACGIQSSIQNSNINDNIGDGIVLRDRMIDFEHNNVMNNSRNGIVAYSGGRFEEFIVNGNYEISNNGWAEFSGYYESYSPWGYTTAVKIIDTGYTNSVDRYLLKHLNYNGSNQVDLSASINTIDYSNPLRFYPSINAFNFGTGQISLVKQLFTSASDDMKSENYTSAESTFKQIIIDYPESVEAASSLENIYFIVNYTNKDFNSLLSYIDNIQPVVSTPLERVKRDVTTRTLMQKEEYAAAISRLELVIRNPETSTELYEAQYDQAYCYVRLAEEGTRALPENCSYKPKDFTEFLNIANELQVRINSSEDFDDKVEYSEAGLVSTNYPNPFNPTTTINFCLSSDSNVSIEVYNVKGQKVKNLINQKMVAGNNSVVWNGDDNKGSKVSSGIYFYKVKTDQSTVMKKIMLLK